MRILKSNKITSSLITVQSESNAFPKENMVNNVLNEKTYVTTYFDVDFGSAVTVDSIGILAEGSGWTVTAGATLGASTFTQVISDTVTFINQTWRYWRFTTSSADYMEYIYLGEYLQIPQITPGSTPQPTSTDVKNRTSGGQVYPTQGTIVKSQDVVAVGLNATEFEAINTWYYSSDRVNNHIVVPFEGSMTVYPFEPYFAEISGYGSFKRDVLAYDIKFKVEQAK
jgi:hypothetical protein